MRRMRHRKWASSVSRGSLADILDSSARTIRDAVAAVRVAVVEDCGTCLERLHAINGRLNAFNLMAANHALFQ